jgi:predicted nucleic acid-binding protein
MIFSSSPPLERGLDTMLIVYSLLQGHPASTTCEQFIRGETGWFTTPLTIFEAKSVLTKVYGVAGTIASQKLVQFLAAPIVLVDVDTASTVRALALADSAQVELTDAVLLQLAIHHGAGWLATEDQRLAQACARLGLTALTPLDTALRQQIAACENAHLRPKGLPRVLRRIHDWLNQRHPQAAQDFWSHTAGASDLP